MELLKNLQWRYATKKMNGETIPEDKLNYILEAIQLAPTSSGIQPFKVLVISNKELKEKIQPVALGQSQIVDSSHILVFAAWNNYTEEKLDDIFKYTLKERGLPLDAMDGYRTNLWGMYSTLPEEWHANHAAKQAYIALGVGIAAAAEQKVDATPMEGFDNAGLDELLGLKEQGLHSAFILALGYRDNSNDWLSSMKKVRRPKDELFVEMA